MPAQSDRSSGPAGIHRHVELGERLLGLGNRLAHAILAVPRIEDGTRELLGRILDSIEGELGELLLGLLRLLAEVLHLARGVLQAPLPFCGLNPEGSDYRPYVGVRHTLPLDSIRMMYVYSAHETHKPVYQRPAV